MGVKSYTGKGDSGSSGLGDGRRARKSEPVFEAVGMLDELNAVIGLARAAADEKEGRDEQLESIQSDLFEAGSFLSGYSKPADANDSFARKLKRLEGWIDEIDAKLPPLANFILPGGCGMAARLHHCRTVCRRAERAIERLEEPAAGERKTAKAAILPYLNRLSSYFFARARLENQQAGVQETGWKGRQDK
ncbi:MAG: cob(I)yrinic acid a,c-diamide adenosyltransferase [Candidatus Marsarchaeota archaeon]|nr:cob(I)yrinic acid a,c-diamide adenosyltransferase [Candidatus Marsarchaeota archaeon]